MPEASFRVILSPEAREDLYEIIDYWSERGEGWRGEKYFHDLTQKVQHELTDPAHAIRGRPVKGKEHRDAREFLAFGVYRVIYSVHEQEQRVEVLRFWHAHRHDPGGEL